MPAVLPDIPAVEAAIVAMTNTFRAEHHEVSVAPDKKLAAAARSYAAFLAKSGAFSHQADGREAGDRVAAQGYEWCQVGENLALNQASRGFAAPELAKKAVEGWINSPHHRANMLAADVTEIGVGVAKAPDKDPKYISVQLFARPKSLEVEFQISNTSREPVSYSFGGETHEVLPSFSVTHTSCAAGPLTFEQVGKGLGAKALSMRYEATDGTVYRLEPDEGGGVRIEVAPLERVR